MIQEIPQLTEHLVKSFQDKLLRIYELLCTLFWAESLERVREMAAHHKQTMIEHLTTLYTAYRKEAPIGTIFYATDPHSWLYRRTFQKMGEDDVREFYPVTARPNTKVNLTVADFVNGLFVKEKDLNAWNRYWMTQTRKKKPPCVRRVFRVIKQTEKVVYKGDVPLQLTDRDREEENRKLYCLRALMEDIYPQSHLEVIGKMVEQRVMVLRKSQMAESWMKYIERSPPGSAFYPTNIYSLRFGMKCEVVDKDTIRWENGDYFSLFSAEHAWEHALVREDHLNEDNRRRIVQARFKLKVEGKL